MNTADYIVGAIFIIAMIGLIGIGVLDVLTPDTVTVTLERCR